MVVGDSEGYESEACVKTGERVSKTVGVEKEGVRQGYMISSRLFS